MDIEDIKDLIITMDKTSIEKIEIEKNDLKIMISKRIAGEGNALKSTIEEPGSSDVPARIAGDGVQEFKNKIGEAADGESPIDDENTFIVRSPMVGIFYKASGSGAPPFTKVGDMVQKGQTLCIIEAMKIMNEIECEYGGQIIEIFVEDECIVEFGQPLMLIRR